MLFRSNDTATTEIYTLSPHDALPIFELVLPMVEGREMEVSYEDRGPRAEVKETSGELRATLDNGRDGDADDQ